MRRWMTALLALALLAALPVSAAAAEDEQGGEPEQEQALTEEQIAALDRIGEESGDEQAYRIVLENATGMDIAAFALREIAHEEWSESLLAEDDVFEDGEKALLCWTPSEDENDMAMYELLLTFEDETEYQLHMVHLSDMEQAQLLTDEDSGLIYVAYTSLFNGKPADTLKTELRFDAAAQEQAGWSFTGSSDGGGASAGGNTTGCVGDGALFY